MALCLIQLTLNVLPAAISAPFGLLAGRRGRCPKAVIMLSHKKEADLVENYSLPPSFFFVEAENG